MSRKRYRCLYCFGNENKSRHDEEEEDEEMCLCSSKTTLLLLNEKQKMEQMNIPVDKTMTIIEWMHETNKQMDGIKEDAQESSSSPCPLCVRGEFHNKIILQCGHVFCSRDIPGLRERGKCARCQLKIVYTIPLYD